MKHLALWLLAGALALAGCADDKKSSNDDDDETSSSSQVASTNGAGGAGVGGMGAGGMGTGGMAGLIPDPGTQPAGEWTDQEPNDTPSQATPMGILTGPLWMGFVEPYTAINPANDVDYFVFRTGDAASLGNVYMSICWTFAGDLLDLTLYEVVNSMQGPSVATGGPGDGCETLVDFGQGSTVLTPDTVYLLEIAAAPGLDLMGDPGLYMA